MTTCGAVPVVAAVLAGCGGGSDSETLAAEDVVRQAAIVAPTTPGWDWQKARISSTPYSKDEGGNPPPAGDPLTARLYRRLRGLGLIGDAGSRWEDSSKLANLAVELWSSAGDAHTAMPAYREYAHSWAENTGAVRDEAVDGLGDEAWRISARGYGEEVTYKWRRGKLVLEAHIQCLTACRSDLDKAARAWVDAIDDEARRSSA